MTVTSERRPLSPTMKMAELMDLNFNLLGVLTRMGLPFGFGDDTVEGVCRKGGVNVHTFLLICSVYAFDGYRPSQEILMNIDVRDIVKYLRRSHTYYMDVAVKELEGALEALMQPCAEIQRKVLRTFFREYREELEKHFDYEENTVFPHVEAVLDQTAPKGYSMGEYEKNHSNVEEKLEDLKNLVMYLPPECDQQQIYRALFYIYTLELDLAKHTTIEDDILIPAVGRMEGKVDNVRPEGGEELSAREKEILVAVAQGKLNKEIADEFCISIHTVITHRKNITRKTGIKTVAGLTVYALLNNLIDINQVD